MNGIAVPTTVGLIMDGNGRWAKKRLLPRGAGHRAGMKRMISLSEHAFSRGVEYFTLFALSAENLSRPREELETLFSLFREYFSENAGKLAERGVAFRCLGDLSLLPNDIAGLIRREEEETKGGERGTLALAIGYGGRQDVLSAVNRAIGIGKPLGAEEFSALLSTRGMPEPDLLIRTGGEMRLSNFLLWQCAYTELYFSEKMFPAFTNADFDRALENYAGRERRYGRISAPEGR